MGLCVYSTPNPTMPALGVCLGLDLDVDYLCTLGVQPACEIIGFCL